MRTSWAKRRPLPARGFATVEVLVAVAIVLLVGSVAIVSLGATDRARLRQDTAAVALLLQQARVQALESGQSVVIRWDQDAQELAAGGRSHVLASKVTGSSATAGTRVHPSGESGGFQLTLATETDQNEVTLDWLTGRVSAVR